jgi:hypothetical protein
MDVELLEEGKRHSLSELHYSRLQVVENEDGPAKITAVVSVADQKNLNSRIYPLSLWEKVLPIVNAEIERHPGLADHPDGAPSVADIAVNWSRFYLDGKTVMGEGYIVPTAKGKDIEAIARSGVALGISTRGMGSAKRKEVNGETVMVIGDDYEFLSADFVVEPSCESARVVQIEHEEEVDWDQISVEGLATHRPDLISVIESNAMNDNESKENEAQVNEATETEVVDEKVEATEPEDAPIVEETEAPAVEEQAEATEELTEAERVKATLTEALAEMTCKYEETAGKLAEVEAEKAELAESVENWNGMLAAIAKQCHEDVDAENFYSVGDLAWMARMAKWGRDDEKYAAAMAAADGVESALKRIAKENLARYIREKCKAERFSVLISEALIASCATVEDVESQFAPTKSRIESEMSGMPKVETKGVVKDPEPKSKLPSDVEQAIGAMESFGK